MRIGFPGICVALLLLTSGVRAEWSEPADGAFTDKQLTSCLAVSREWIARMEAAGKSVDGTQAGLKTLIAYTRSNDKFKDSLAKSGLESPEFNWLSKKSWEAWNAIMVDQTLKQMDDALAEQTKKDTDQIAIDQAKIAEYQQEIVSGKRVLTPDERAAAITQAQSEEQAAADQVNQHAEEAKTAVADLAKSEADATAADAAAGSPPSDLSDDDKANFVAVKQAEAQAARDSAQEDRMKLSDAKEAMAAAQATADAANEHARQPEIAQTDEEKAALARQNQQMIAKFQAEISRMPDTIKRLDDADAAARAALLQQHSKIPSLNLMLIKGHAKEFARVWHIKLPDTGAK
jgi:hypothetical protein